MANNRGAQKKRKSMIRERKNIDDRAQYHVRICQSRSNHDKAKKINTIYIRSGKREIKKEKECPAASKSLQGLLLREREGKKEKEEIENKISHR